VIPCHYRRSGESQNPVRLYREACLFFIHRKKKLPAYAARTYWILAFARMTG
jgi:hypothetical protein